jgi:hypothetical protein
MENRRVHIGGKLFLRALTAVSRHNQAIRRIS